MPIPFFVWIAIALAVLMVGGGAAVSVSKLPEVVRPIAESADSFLAPLGTGMFPAGALSRHGFGSSYKKAVRDHAGAFIDMGAFGEVLPRFKKVPVPEMNLAQLALLLRAKHLVDVISYTKVEGKPFNNFFPKKEKELKYAVRFASYHREVNSKQ